MRDISYINLSDSGRACARADLTKAEWAEEFALRKGLVPSVGSYSFDFGKYQKNSEKEGVYNGDTNYQTYVSFMNQVAKNIFKGETEYVFFTYQITALLHYFGSELQSDYIPEARCFSVWRGRR